MMAEKSRQSFREKPTTIRRLLQHIALLPEIIFLVTLNFKSNVGNFLYPKALEYYKM